MQTYNVTVRCREAGALGIFGETYSARVNAVDEDDARDAARAEACAHGYEPYACVRVDLED